MIADRSNGDIACDSFHKYKEDVAIMEDIGVSYFILRFYYKTRMITNSSMRQVYKISKISDCGSMTTDFERFIPIESESANENSEIMFSAIFDKWLKTLFLTPSTSFFSKSRANSLFSDSDSSGKNVSKSVANGPAPNFC